MAGGQGSALQGGTMGANSFGKGMQQGTTGTQFPQFGGYGRMGGMDTGRMPWQQSFGQQPFGQASTPTAMTTGGLDALPATTPLQNDASGTPGAASPMPAMTEQMAALNQRPFAATGGIDPAAVPSGQPMPKPAVGNPMMGGRLPPFGMTGGGDPVVDPATQADMARGLFTGGQPNQDFIRMQQAMMQRRKAPAMGGIVQGDGSQ